MTAAQEFAVKCERVRSILDMHSLNAVVIQKATNLAWLLAGAECWIGRTMERGSCSAVITRDDCHVLMNAIEAPRLSAEELAGLGATVHEFAWHQDSSGDSAVESQNLSSSSRSTIGSERIPPSGNVMSAYLHWPTAHVVKSRNVNMSTNASASGPVISTWRSAPTSHSVTSLTSAWYSSNGSP